MERKPSAVVSKRQVEMKLKAIKGILFRLYVRIYVIAITNMCLIVVVYVTV